MAAAKAKNKFGFTLLEILLVVALIVGLSTLWISNFPGAQKSARDARRREDLDTYKASLELYANNNSGVYPLFTAAGGSSITSETSSAVPCQQLRVVAAGLQSYLASCPRDPRNTGQHIYKYKTNSSATNYCLWTKLERSLVPGMEECYRTCTDGVTGNYPSGGVNLGVNCPDGL